MNSNYPNAERIDITFNGIAEKKNKKGKRLLRHVPRHHHKASREHKEFKLSAKSLM